MDAIREADIIAAVLPLELLHDVQKAANGKPVIFSVSGRISTGRFLTLPDGRQEKEYVFAHICWKQLIRMDIGTVTL